MRVGIDIGGTFTDFSLFGHDGAIRLWKEPSTTDDPARAITVGLAALADAQGLSVKELLAQASLLVHGTTIATNAVIQRIAPAVGLLCTEGFRDVLYFRDGYKRERFNLHVAHPTELVARYLRIGVPERTISTGEVIRPLDEDAVRAAAQRFREAGAASVAVAFMWSVANPAHEIRAAQLLREELPDTHVLCSSDVLREIREWERTSATVLSAYVLPLIADYLRRLEAGLRARGLAAQLLIMQSNGGCASVEQVLQSPVSILASGPAAAPAAALFHAAELQQRDLITVDMGGTSFDVCLIRDGEPTLSRELRVAEQPVGVQGVDVHSVGAGGGSIAWVDSGGGLRVGPRSAGAEPGPACYALGGAEPTVTDANVTLGYLSPSAFLGGRRALDADLAREAILRHVAEPLELSVEQAAAGILRVVDSNMVAAIRAVSTERGIDPRRFLLVVGGGAGGLHATRLARELGMASVLVPREAGTLCAFGMTVTDIRRDYVASLHQSSATLDVAQVQRVLAEMEGRALAELNAHGVPPRSVEITHHADARYPGQLYELTVLIPPPTEDPDGFARAVERSYHREHERLYTFCREDLGVEVLHWRVAATGHIAAGAKRPRGEADAPARTSVVGERTTFFAQSGWVTTRAHAAHLLEPGVEVAGPAVIEAPTTTVLLEPRDVLTVTASGNLLISADRSNAGESSTTQASGRRIASTATSQRLQERMTS